jgi:hypothetical protein
MHDSHEPVKDVQDGWRVHVKPALRAVAFLLLLATYSVNPPNLSAVNLAGAAIDPAWTSAAPAGSAEEAVTVDWRMLGMLDYASGTMPPALKALDGKRVKVPGFVVPLEDFAQEGNEFLLVPYFGACVHVPPPPPNQIVYVKMGGGKNVRTGWWEPVWMEGTLRIRTVESVYGSVGFQMVGLRIAPYEE